MTRLPLPPDAAVLRGLTRPEQDVVTVQPDTRLARIFTAHSTHPQYWNGFRYAGPLPHAPFDPQPASAGDVPSAGADAGVLYFGLTVRTSVAEAYQTTSTVDRSTKGPHLVVLRPRRPLRLLDLTGPWPARAGAAQLTTGAPKATTQLWARAVRAAHPQVDGLWYRSTMDSAEPVVCLWDPPAGSALPDEPDFLAPLNHPGLDVPLGRVCEDLNYTLLS